jgi:hypothetical protein
MKTNFRIIAILRRLAPAALFVATFSPSPAHAGQILFSSAFTDEASTGISTANSYTHTISGGSAQTVNGVTFDRLAPGVTPANFTWNSSTTQKNQLSGNLGDWTPVAGLSGTSSQNLLRDFTFSADGTAAGASQTYTLSGLTPGEQYELRIYFRVWSDATTRDIDLTFTHGAEVDQLLGFQEDRPENPAFAGFASRDDAGYLSYFYLAKASQLEIEATVAAGGNGSFHLYALSNQRNPPGIGESASVALDTRSFGESGTVPLETSQVTVNDNGDGSSNVEPVGFTRDNTASDTLYFRYTVNPISDFTTEIYFAGLQLYEGGAERLGVGNAVGALAYSAYNATGGNVDLNSATPEAGVLWERVRKGVPRTIVFRVDYMAGGGDNITVWLDPDCTLAESEQNPMLRTTFTADASFDQVRLREGNPGPAGADGWTFSGISVGKLFGGYAAAAAAKIPDGAPRGFTEDADDDGLSNGAEYALGTNMATSDTDSPRVPTATTNASGQIEIAFGFNLAAAPDTAWVIKRSTTLEPGSFSEIYRFDGPSMQQTLPGGIGASMTATSITVTDQNPPSPRAFYVFVAEQVVVP